MPPETNPSPDSGPELETPAPPAPLDLEQLAEKIYTLLLRELEIESQRLGKF